MVDAPATSVELVRGILWRGAILSTAMASLLPLVVLALHPPAPATTVLLVGLFSVALGAHAVLRLRPGLRGPDATHHPAGREQHPARSSLLVLALGGAAATAASVVGAAASPDGWAWLALPGLVASDALMIPRARLASWWFSCSALVAGLGAFLVVISPPVGARLWTHDPVVAGAVSLVAVIAVAYLDPPGSALLRRAGRLEEQHRDAVELARTRERLRLSEDLHDVLGHALEVVAFKSELAARVVACDVQRASREMTEVEQLARSAVTDVRALVRDQRPTDVHAEALAAQLLLGSADIDVTVDFEALPLGPQGQDVLGRVVREAVTNVLRHSNASHVLVRAAQRAGVVEVTVQDDGSGSSTTSRGGTTSIPIGGSGLAGARRRVLEAGGELEAGPSRRGGFAVVARLPANCAVN